jgi:hypothetical protein
MLPRLRFVIAAVVIALLPMLVLGHVAPTSTSYELSVPQLGLGAVDARAVRELQVVAFARRTDELNRLREMASVPLAAWVAAPTGTEPEAAEAQVASLSPSGPSSEPKDPVENEPATPSASADAAAGAAETKEPDAITADANQSSLDTPAQTAASVVATAVAALASNDAGAGVRPAAFVPPLPHPRPKIQKKKTVKRTRTAQAQPKPAAKLNPFGQIFGFSSPQ